MWWFIILTFVVLVGGLFWMTSMPGQPPALSPSRLDSHDKTLIATLQQYIRHLAGDIGERNFQTPDRLEAAAAYIQQAMRATGVPVRRESFTVNDQEFHNLIAEISGDRKRDEIIVIGAHYDSIVGSPGANDNGSGVAALLALLERLSGSRPSRTVRFVAFANEEPPFYKSEHMGSAVHAQNAQLEKQRIYLMMALETIGYYTDQPNSQRYPFPLSWFYPDRGNFVAVVGNLTTRSQVRHAVRSLREKTSFPAEGIAAPAIFPGIDWSDHWSFWRAGYPALMITDTALFRYPQYHTIADHPGIINYPRLARVVEGLAEVILSFARE